MDSLLDKVLRGDSRALARAATLVENRSAAGAELLRMLFHQTGKGIIFGITGAPGAGKSTLVDQLARCLRKRGKRVAIIAVDPTSPYSGGAVLGDRIRMLDHYADPGVFIRSMASRGHLGGLAAATMDMALLFEGAGFDVVLIETVGVGQDEVDIARVADVTALLLVPGMGDDVQAMKAGIMEIADVYLLNKADLPGADRLQRELEGALALSNSAKPTVVRCVATAGEGIEEALSAFEAARTNTSEQRRIENWALRLREMFRERLAEQISMEDLREAAGQVARRERDPYSVVNEWFANIGWQARSE